MSGERDLHEKGFGRRVNSHTIDSGCQQAQQFGLAGAVIGHYADEFLIPSSRLEARRLTKMRDKNVDLIDGVRQSKFLTTRQQQTADAVLFRDSRDELLLVAGNDSDAGFLEWVFAATDGHCGEVDHGFTLSDQLAVQLPPMRWVDRRL